MRTLLIMMATLATGSGLLPAQSGLDAWENLQRLRPAQRIEVVDFKRRPLAGSFEGFDGEAIRLTTDQGVVSIPRNQVAVVKDRQTSKRQRNILVGLGWAPRAAWLPERSTAPLIRKRARPACSCWFTYQSESDSAPSRER